MYLGRGFFGTGGFRGFVLAVPRFVRRVIRFWPFLGYVCLGPCSLCFTLVTLVFSLIACVECSISLLMTRFACLRTDSPVCPFFLSENEYYN